ncbi:hypothetical protein PG984_008097 [Apiospora sp. TS-2023a]
METSRPIPITEDMSYGQRLFQHTANTGNLEPHFMTFRGLQRLNIIRLQNDIAQIKRSTSDEKQISREQSEELTKLLHDYTNAIKDYEYLSKLIPVTGSVAKHQRLDLEQAFEEVGALHDDPCGYCRLPDSSLLPSDPLRDALKRMLPKSLTYTEREMDRRTTEYIMGREPPEEVSPFVDRLVRFLVAFAGSLVTVSVAVLLFAATLSVGNRASYTETMVSTATYAAVLVVFVGTTS